MNNDKTTTPAENSTNNANSANDETELTAKETSAKQPAQTKESLMGWIITGHPLEVEYRRYIGALVDAVNNTEGENLQRLYSIYTLNKEYIDLEEILKAITQNNETKIKEYTQAIDTLRREILRIQLDQTEETFQRIKEIETNIKDAEKQPKKRKPREKKEQLKEIVRTCTKLDNELLELIFDKEKRINVLNRYQQKKCFINVTLALEREIENGEITTSKKIKPFEKSILNTCTSLSVQGQSKITANSIYKHMTGTNKKPSKTMRKKIDTAIRRLRKIYIEIRWNAQRELYGIELEEQTDTINDFTVEGYLLPVEIATITAKNGEKISEYSIIKTPVLYVYANALDQVSRIPLEDKKTALNGIKRVNSTHILIAEEIIRRIQIYESKKKQNEKRKSKQKINLLTYRQISMEELYRKIIDFDSQEWQSMTAKGKEKKLETIQEYTPIIIENLGYAHTLNIID